MEKVNKYLNIKDYFTIMEINGKPKRVLNLEDCKRFDRDRRKLEKQGKVRMRSQTKRRINDYQYQKSWGGMPFADNNSLLKIDVNLFM